MNEDKIKQLDRLIGDLERVLREAKETLRDLENKKDYKDVPGIEGTFDGIYMITDSGEKHEVPPNYAAKSRLVYGDRLKLIKEENQNGRDVGSVGGTGGTQGESEENRPPKDVFKQIIKVPRKKLQGVLNKKEGKWYVLTSAGTYKISDKSAEFNNLLINQEVDVLVPENNMNAPFAALDFVKKPAENTFSIAPKATKRQTPVVKQPAAGSVAKFIVNRPANSSAQKPFVSSVGGRRPKPPAPEFKPKSRAVEEKKDIEKKTERIEKNDEFKPQPTATRILDDEDLR